MFRFYWFGYHPPAHADSREPVEKTRNERRTNNDKKDFRVLKFLVVGLVSLVTAGCGIYGREVYGQATETYIATTAPQSTRTSLPPTQTDIPTSTATLAPTSTPDPTPTLDPFAEYTIANLTSRSYGGGELHIEETLADNAFFTRFLFSYPSDGLTIYGFMNIPNRGTPPYPVVIASHGYINPSVYDTIDYTTRYADSLALSGYLVLHPNLRGYPPSDEGDNLFRVGMAVDVLNLVALVREWGGQPGPLEAADPESIGLWGHSMGGGVTLRAITIDPDVDAAVLYGSMSGDEYQNFSAILEWSEGERGLLELNTPEDDLQRISPIFHLDRINAAVSVHHGEADDLVPPEWSEDLCTRLGNLEKTFTCYTYPGQPHTFYGEGDQLLMARTVNFFDHYLKEE